MFYIGGVDTTHIGMISSEVLKYLKGFILLIAQNYHAIIEIAKLI